VTHALLERLASADPAERLAACREAVADPHSALLAPALGRALGDPEKTVARAASDSLVAIGRATGGIDDVLREALGAEDEVRRRGAALTAARVAPPGPRLLPALVDALAADDGDVRWASARVLVDMARLHGEVVPLLVGLAHTDARPGVRRMAVHTLRKLAGAGAGIDEALLAAAGDDDAAVRRAALTALAGLLEPSDAVFARLTAILGSDADAASRRLAALALGELGERRGGLPAPAARALAGAVRTDADDDLRRAALRAHERLGNARPAADADGLGEARSAEDCR
jgi:hypothetical protein